jgi:hypothetical protein
LAFLLAAGSIPFDVAPAEAARFKFRYRSPATARPVAKAEEVAAEPSRSPTRIFIGRSSSNSASASDSQDEKSRPRLVGRAAAAAARAQTALDAEKTQVRGKSAAVHEPTPLGPTTDYADGVSCIAGC